MIDGHDVERADRRAAALCKAGLWTLPVVAGEAVAERGTAALRDRPVVLVPDGRSQGWEVAIAALGSQTP